MRKTGKAIKILGFATMYIAGAMFFVPIKIVSPTLVVLAVLFVIVGKFLIGYDKMIQDEREENTIRNHRIQEGFIKE